MPSLNKASTLLFENSLPMVVAPQEPHHILTAPLAGSQEHTRITLVCQQFVFCFFGLWWCSVVVLSFRAVQLEELTASQADCVLVLLHHVPHQIVGVIGTAYKVCV
jgi:hypothetical protein